MLKRKLLEIGLAIVRELLETGLTFVKEIGARDRSGIC